MWDVFKKRDGEAVAAGSLELKARGISCSGWVVRIGLMGWNVCSREMVGQCGESRKAQ